MNLGEWWPEETLNHLFTSMLNKHLVWIALKKYSDWYSIVLIARKFRQKNDTKMRFFKHCRFLCAVTENRKKIVMRQLIMWQLCGNHCP